MSEPTFQQLTEQVQRLTQRVAALERELGVRAPMATAEVAAPASTASLREADLEQKLGLRFVNRVGAVTLILGIAFFFRYAVENNWISETARVLLGLCAGLTLLAGGEFWYRREQRVFAQGISGTGAGILYLSCYAAFDPYRLISVPVALFALVGVTLFAGALAVRYQSQAIAILSLLGGLLVPELLHQEQLGEWFVPIYVAVLDAVFLSVAERYGWGACKWLALVGTAVFTVNMNGAPLWTMLPVYYVLFGLQANRALFVASHALFLGRATFLPHRLEVYAPYLVGMSGAGLGVIRWRKWSGLTALLVSMGAVSWAFAGGELPLGGALGTLGVLFVLFLTSPERLSLPLNAVFLFGAGYARLHGGRDSWAALLALSMAGVYFGLAYAFRDERRAVCGVTAHVLLLTAIGIEVVHRAGPTNAASATISILYAVYAVALVALGTATRSAASRYLGLGLIALVVGKLYVYDVWQLDTVYRFTAFAALGGLLLTMSFFYSRYRDRIASWLK